MEHDWVKVWSGVEKNDFLALLKFRIHSDSEYTQIHDTLRFRILRFRIHWKTNIWVNFNWLNKTCFQSNRVNQLVIGQISLTNHFLTNCLYWTLLIISNCIKLVFPVLCIFSLKRASVIFNIYDNELLLYFERFKMFDVFSIFSSNPFSHYVCDASMWHLNFMSRVVFLDYFLSYSQPLLRNIIISMPELQVSDISTTSFVTFYRGCEIWLAGKLTSQNTGELTNQDALNGKLQASVYGRATEGSLFFTEFGSHDDYPSVLDEYPIHGQEKVSPIERY